MIAAKKFMIVISRDLARRRLPETESSKDYICPEICRYWKRYFLWLDASVRRNRVLRFLDYFEHAYAEVAAVVKGRCVILYAFSLMAWTESAYLKQFVVVSVVLMALLYLLLSMAGMIRGLCVRNFTRMGQAA